MKTVPREYPILLTVFFLWVVLLSSAGAKEITASYLYNLSNFTGSVPYSWARVSIDREKNEVYLASTADAVRIFNRTGMEVYSFNDDGDLGSVEDVVVEKNGNILMLSYAAAKYSIIVCNYRGEPISRIELKNLPQNFSRFNPTAMAYRDGHIYLADKERMAVVVTDESGTVEKTYDILPMLQVEEKKKSDVDMRGFSVDNEGNMLFTVPVLFRAYTLSHQGKLTGFGQRGSSPGKFNVVSGIASDERGNYFVADVLKCAVLVFDKEFKFIGQFGYRGFDPEGLIAPMDVAVYNGKLYVSQSAGRGVSVFAIEYD